MLKVSPARYPQSSSSRAPPAAGAFEALDKGFLNKPVAKRGLSPPPGAGKSAGSLASAAELLAKTEDIKELLLPAANVESGMTEDVIAFAKEVELRPPGSASAAAGAGGDDADVDGDAEGADAAPAPSLSELANELFGGGDIEDAPGEDGERTESTHTPSPKGSHLGGGAPSERSEPATEDGVETGKAHPRTPPAGIRLLQQRRKAAGAAAVEAGGADGTPSPGTGSAAAAAAPPEAAGPEPRDECDELLKLWMGQRW